MPGESTTSSGGTRADGGAEEAVEVAKSEAAEPDIQGEWCYVSTLTGVPHVFEVARGGGGGGLVWREGDVQGDLAGVTEETEHGLFDADWTTRPGGVNGRLWIKSVGDGPLQMLETLFRKADTPPIHETAARKDNRLVGTWRYTSSTTGTEHAYTIFPTKGVLEWRESGLSGKVSHVPEGKPSNPAYTFKVDLHDGEALWLSLEAGAPQPRLRSLYCETPETAGICEVASQHDGPPDFVTVGTPVQFWDGGGASKGPDQKWVAGKLVCMNADGTYEVKGTGEEGRSSTQSVSRDSLRVLDADNPVTTLLLSHRSTHSEEDLCAKQNKLLAEVNKSIAQIDCMGVAVIARPGRERAPKPILNNKPFKHLERVFVKASSQELQELSAKHGGWGGELMAECCRKVGVVYKPTAGQDPMVMFSDGQVWRMNQRALARDNEMRDLVEAAQLNQPMPLVSKKQRPRRTVRWRVGDVAKTSSLEQTQPAAKETPQARRERLGISQDARKRILKRSLSPDQLEMRNKGAGGPSPPRVPADTRPPANPTAARRLSNNATGTPPMPTHPVCPAAGGPPKSRSGGSREQRQPAGARGFARADEADRQQKPAAGDCHQAAAPPPPPPPPPHGQGEGDAGRAGELPARPGAVEGPQVPSDGRKKTKDEAARLRSGGDDGEAKRVGRRSKLESFPSKARSCSAQPVSASADDSSARIASASPSAVPRFKLLKKSRFSSSFKSPARSASADAAAGPVAGSEYRKGERVDIFYDNGWFPATIRRKRPDDHGYDIRYLTGELSFSVLPQYMRKGRGPEVPAAGPPAGAPPHGAQKRARKASPSPAAGGGCSPSPSPKGHTRKLSPAGAKARFAPDPPSAAA